MRFIRVMFVTLSLVLLLSAREQVNVNFSNLEIADFIKLVIGFKRVSNIISAVTDHSIPNPELFELAAEGALFAALQNLHTAIDAEFVRQNYPGILQHLIAMGANIDAFFEEVLVNCENEDLRRNRYALLSMVRAEFLRFADLSLIVVEND